MRVLYFDLKESMEDMPDNVLEKLSSNRDLRNIFMRHESKYQNLIRMDPYGLGLLNEVKIGSDLLKEVINKIREGNNLELYSGLDDDAEIAKIPDKTEREKMERKRNSYYTQALANRKESVRRVTIEDISDLAGRIVLMRKHSEFVQTVKSMSEEQLNTIGRQIQESLDRQRKRIAEYNRDDYDKAEIIGYFESKLIIQTLVDSIPPKKLSEVIECFEDICNNPDIMERTKIEDYMAEKMFGKKTRDYYRFKSSASFGALHPIDIAEALEKRQKELQKPTGILSKIKGFCDKLKTNKTQQQLPNGMTKKTNAELDATNPWGVGEDIVNATNNVGKNSKRPSKSRPFDKSQKDKFQR